MTSKPATVRLRVERVERETADAVSLVLSRADGGVLEPRPGQFVTVRLPGGGARCYSFSRVGPEPRITVKRVPGGRGSSWLCQVRAGTELTALPPSGAFTLRDADADLLLVAGGSGITPVLSLARAALTGGGGRVVLLYANRDERSVIFARELRDMAAAHPGRLLVLHWLESVQGRPTADALRPLTAPYAASEAYLCGPGPFMDAAAAALRSHGVPRERVHREVFVSLTGDAFESADRAPASAQAPPPVQAPASAQVSAPGDAAGASGEESAGTQGAGTGAGAALDLALDGEHHRLVWPASATLLDTLVAQRLDPPFSCREGSCGACACRVVAGEVAQRTTGVLTDEDLADGYVLACQSLPASDRVSVSYD
ncbi:ferredoxin--NADP reductase [Streptomyces albus]|uniref:ferredoxin--NADP reductase n=1 Tax=Streptomyces sp. PHES57 TaxID=2872626 RepID=UPI001CECA5DB|nr:ferredoxin--NADP reductase [Streptomyces sp. PHES57]